MNRLCRFAVLISAVLGFAATAAAGGALPEGLIDTAERPFTVAALKSHWTLLTFGFTRCGVTCPVTLANAHRFLAMQPTPPVDVVFVTLDPLHDDPATLRRYLTEFDPRLVGVTGDPAAIDMLAHQLHVGITHEDGTLQHSAEWYLVAPNLRIVGVFPAAQTSGSDLKKDVAQIQTHYGVAQAGMRGNRP